MKILNLKNMDIFQIQKAAKKCKRILALAEKTKKVHPMLPTDLKRKAGFAKITLDKIQIHLAK